MELKKTTIKGREIFVMFTGDKYFFYSNYYGTLAIAERKENKTVKNGGNKCPECGESIVNTGGCISCPSCGWSKCN